MSRSPLLDALRLITAALLLAVPRPGAAVTQTFTSAGAISIPTGGTETDILPADPYPSTINVSGLIGTINKVTVTLHDVTHAIASDLDVLLVGPTGVAVMLMSDAGVDLSGTTLTFDDDSAAGPVPALSVLPGTYRATDLPFNFSIADLVEDDSFPASASLPNPPPTGPYQASLSAFNDTNPIGTWRLFVVDDFGADVGGAIAGGWSLTITAGESPPATTTISQTSGAITIPDAGPADPYPSGIVVSGLPGVVSRVTVSLNSFGHTFPADVRAVLVGPAGQAVVLTNAAGNADPVSGITLTFDDDAAFLLSDTDTLTTGTFKPTRYPTDVLMAPPAPLGPYRPSLSAFRNTDPNGTWRLFVLDGFFGDSGSIAGGWTLAITTAAGTPTTPVRVVPLDFDGDRRTDFTLYRRFSSATYLVALSSGGTVEVGGGNLFFPLSDIPIPGDYDGDGKTDFAVYDTRPDVGQASFVLRSADAGFTQFFCCPGTPVPGDYDGDGKTDLAFYDPAFGDWFILGSADGLFFGVNFGDPAILDQPIPADYDGDGRTDLATYATKTGQVRILRSSDSGVVTLCCASPLAQDMPIVGDYDGDRKADPAVYRFTTGQFIIFLSSTSSLVQVCCGSPTQRDVPVPGDYDGDGRIDLAVYRFNTGQYFALASSTASLIARPLGNPAILDIPPLDPLTFGIAITPPPPPPPVVTPSPPPSGGSSPPPVEDEGGDKSSPTQPPPAKPACNEDSFSC